MMEIRHGFELIDDTYIEELQTQAQLYRHVKTGAELLSMLNDDENKVFGITFRTPPRDSAGLPHILEHSVLCGSRKFPVKEPFVEILKGSLQTFLNAFTYPDKTCYPVASQNVQDFYNLIDVYLDAVFYPNITPFIFQQEGWHYELEEKDRPLTYKGVVFNEMKGAYSSPDRLIMEYSQQSLFPDNAYHFDSGGHPEKIPSLTYRQFKEFHRTYYHPTNARIYFYGDDDPDERLRLTNEYIKDFDILSVESTVTLQQSFPESRRFEYPFATGETSQEQARGMITVNWLLPETVHPDINMALTVLNYILLGMSGSPLRKALIDSGWGEGLTGGGLESDLRQMFFSIGLKGFDISKVDACEELIINTLARLVDEGIAVDTITAALNTIEFQLRENNTGNYPRGLVLMLRALTTWLYDGDPLILLNYEPHLNTIKARLQKDPSYFETLITRYFLANSHRTTVLMKPDPDLGRQIEDAEKQRLDEIKVSLDATELQKTVDDTRRLNVMQTTPDTPEALATIPMLKLADLDRKNKTIPLAVLEREDVRVLYHDLFTNGIVYADVGFALDTMPDRYIPYIPLLGRLMTQMGTAKDDYVRLSQKISSKTGGIRHTTYTSLIKDSRNATTWLFLRGKAMQDKTEDLLSIMNDIILTTELDNRKRFRQIVLEEKARREQRVVPSGHQIVNLRLRAHFDGAGWADEQMNGISYLFFLRDLARRIDTDWPSVLDDLRTIVNTLVNRNTMICNVTVDEKRWNMIDPLLNPFLKAFPETVPEPAAWPLPVAGSYEGMTIPAQVNYVGKGADIYRLGYRFHGSAMVIIRYLRTAWLWDRIRVQGGAYGAFCLFNHLSGVLTFLSYRDPNLVRTIETFDETARYLKNIDLSPAELTKGIIGAIGDMDAYMLPDAKGYTSMLRYLNGNSDAARQQMRDEILSTTIDDFRAFAGAVEAAKKEGIIKILGYENAIKDAIETHGLPLEVFEVL